MIVGVSGCPEAHYNGTLARIRVRPVKTDDDRAASLIHDAESLGRDGVDCAGAMKQVETIDHEAWYLLRVGPYCTVDHQIAGSVVTLTDITPA